MLPIEAPIPTTATIGGLLATALTGPRRYGGGSLRDVIIGITVAYPDGTVGKAGGLVVKNVSGLRHDAHPPWRARHTRCDHVGEFQGAAHTAIGILVCIHPFKSLATSAMF